MYQCLAIDIAIKLDNLEHYIILQPRVQKSNIVNILFVSARRDILIYIN